MHYSLSNINIDMMQKVEEQTKSGKVHGKQEINVNSEKRKEELNWNKNNEKKDEEKIKFDISKYSGKGRAIEIKVHKAENVEIEAEKEEKYAKGSLKGLLIDVRK